jgi:hypothetical protein
MNQRLYYYWPQSRQSFVAIDSPDFTEHDVNQGHPAIENFSFETLRVNGHFCGVKDIPQSNNVA